MIIPPSRTGRVGHGQLSPELDAKLPEAIPCRRPFHWSTWLRRLAFWVPCVLGLAVAWGCAFLQDVRERQLAELSRQRACFATFLRSPEFAAFTAAMDREFVATFNFVSARPQVMRALLPEVAAREAAQRQVPWASEVMPLPVWSAQPAAVLRTHRTVGRLLAQRGMVFDEARRRNARRVMLQLLGPHLVAFHQRAPEYDFSALGLDRTMQEAALAAAGAHFAPDCGIAESERLFGLYAIVGPEMWRAIEERRAAAGNSRIASLKR